MSNNIKDAMREYFIYPDWLAPINVVAACATLAAGDSAPPELLATPGIRSPLIRQVHGTQVVDAAQVGEGVEADAIVSRQAGLVCRVVTADCLPILLCNRLGTEIAAVHAGWRGLAAGVIESTLAALHSQPGDLQAWIGPAISQRHFEVGAEVRAAFLDPATAEQRLDMASCFQTVGEKYLADLAGLANNRLRQLGVPSVYGGELCTYADPARFHSWRRDGAAAGRMASVICILPAAKSRAL